jgi:hypothetical protein
MPLTSAFSKDVSPRHPLFLMDIIDLRDTHYKLLINNVIQFLADRSMKIIFITCGPNKELDGEL